jgi:hypothetical protein
MVETIFHGSDKIIRNPEFGRGNPNNDYGLGFYATKNKGLAGEWAVLYTEKDGYINQYTFDTAGLNILYLNQEPVEKWVALLAAYRQFREKEVVMHRVQRFIDLFRTDISEYDVIEGWRADDAFFSYITDFFTVGLSIEKLKEAMKFGDLGNQVCLKSEAAFGRIKFVEPAHTAAVERFYKSAVNRDEKAKQDYWNMPDKTHGTLILDIIGREYI